MAKLAKLLPLVLLASSACTKSEPAREEPKAASAPLTATNPHGENPHAASPHAGTAHQGSTQPTGAPGAGGLTWRAESPLVARPPKSSMRAAEYTLANDPSAELTVFYFGEGQGGDIESNITRWLGQFSQADGSDSAKHAKRSERTVAGLSVATVEVTGVYGGGMAMPGAPAPEPQSDAMLLGAIAKGPKGPVFFKLVGKRDSVESARTAFDALVESLKPAS